MSESTLTNETRREYEQRRALEIAHAAINGGYRAFIAENGNYGFYTDAEGSRIVSFQVNGYFEESASGNYVTNQPKQTGTGWRMVDSVNTDSLKAYFDASPPHWAVGKSTWRYATLEDQKNRYQSSSRYAEVKL